MDEIKISSNRSFGTVFFIVFLLIALYPLLKGNDLRIWSLIISIIFLILGLINSKLLVPFNRLWFKFGLFLGKIISPLIMGLIFFAVVTPIGILMRILGIDPGISITGFSIIDSKKNRTALLAYGTIRPKSKDSLPKRLNYIFIKHKECIVLRWFSCRKHINYKR